MYTIFPKAASLAQRAAMPGFIEPQQPLLVDRAAGDKWLSEIKLDGYRIRVRCDRKRVTVYSRGGLDWTDRIYGSNA